jgi:hypothetical protein
LVKRLIDRFPTAKSYWDVSDLFPIMFVDFDRKHVCACYSDGTRMERYVPLGWSSEFRDFLTSYPEELFPSSEKFWIQSGVNLLEEVCGRSP